MIKSTRQYNDTKKLLTKYSKLLNDSLPVDDDDLENDGIVDFQFYCKYSKAKGALV